MNHFQSYFGAYWKDRPLTLRDFETELADFIVGLNQVHPIFAKWYALGAKMGDEKPLGSELQHFHEVVAERAWDKRLSKASFTNLDTDGNPTPESTSRVGWSSSLLNRREREHSETSAHILVAAGGTSSYVSSSVTITVDDRRSPLLEPNVSERLLRYMISFWDPDEAVAAESDFTDSITFDGAMPTLGRLNYFKVAPFESALPKPVHRVALRDGVFFRIGDGRPLGAENQTEIELGREVLRVLKELEHPPTG